jgi:hypothetical protein
MTSPNLRRVFVAGALLAAFLFLFFRVQRPPAAPVTLAPRAAARTFDPAGRTTNREFVTRSTDRPPKSDVILEIHRPWVWVGDQLVFVLTPEEFEKIGADYRVENADGKAPIWITKPAPRDGTLR